MTAYEEMNVIERALADARIAFENVLGQHTGYHRIEARRTHSLYMLKGREVGRARTEIHRTLYHDRVRYQDSTKRRYLEVFVAAAEESIKALQRAPRTKVNTERIDNCISQLEDVVDYSNAALNDEDAEKAAKAAEEIARWPEDKERGQEIQRWASCLTIALNLIQNLGGDPNADGEEFYSWTPQSLASTLAEIRDERPEYEEELNDVINALDDGNVTGAWMVLYDFEQKRKAGDGE